MRNFSALILSIIILLLNSCGQPEPIKQIDPVICGEKSTCILNSIINLEAQLRIPAPVHFQIKLDGDTVFSTCALDSFDPERVQVKYAQGKIEMIYRGFSGAPKVDLEIIERGTACASYFIRIRHDDYKLTISRERGLTIHKIIVTQPL